MDSVMFADLSLMKGVQVEYVTEAQAKLLRECSRLVKPVQPP